MLLADRYSKAIEAARRHGGLRGLIDELHLEMNEAQAKALSEMKPMQISIDVTKLVNAGRDDILSVPIEKTLIQIARMAAPTPISELKKLIEDVIGKHPLMHHILGVFYNAKGRVVARPKAALAHMALAFVISHPGITSAIIGPRTPEQLDDLLAGMSVTLSDEVLDRMDRIVPPGHDIAPLEHSAYIPPSITELTLRRRPYGERVI